MLDKAEIRYSGKLHDGGRKYSYQAKCKVAGDHVNTNVGCFVAELVVKLY